ncbi:hypothetical protein VTK73DRAFT_8173 [Phialemonium thermophilum]|uniref:Uncharacterized protein n=1 Tax=Phialemonium thermophilum TaxID=223376 RepID=A0ABR3WA61_9PEZI
MEFIYAKDLAEVLGSREGRGVQRTRKFEARSPSGRTVFPRSHGSGVSKVTSSSLAVIHTQADSTGPDERYCLHFVTYFCSCGEDRNISTQRK